MRQKHVTILSASLLAILSGVFVLYCGSGDMPKLDDTKKTVMTLDHRVTVPATPKSSEGMVLLMPETTVPPRSEKAVCWTSKWIPAKDIRMTQFTGMQSKLGQGLFMMRANTPRKPGTVFNCKAETDLSLLKPALPKVVLGKPVPKGYYVKVPKGLNIVFKSVYKNPTDKPIKIADVAVVRFAQNEANLKELK